MSRIKEQAKQDGFVQTVYGRKRWLPELKSKNTNIRKLGERMALNTPIQGTAADIIKLAMIHVYERLQKDVPDARLILQVHDELIVEVPQAHAMQAARVLGEEMQHVIQNTLPEQQQAEFPVPLTADVSMGESWYAAKG